MCGVAISGGISSQGTEAHGGIARTFGIARERINSERSVILIRSGADLWTLRIGELQKTEDGTGNNKDKFDFHLNSSTAWLV